MDEPQVPSRPYRHVLQDRRIAVPSVAVRDADGHNALTNKLLHEWLTHNAASQGPSPIALQLFGAAAAASLALLPVAGTQKCSRESSFLVNTRQVLPFPATVFREMRSPCHHHYPPRQ